jgi:hypothetical protein
MHSCASEVSYLVVKPYLGVSPANPIIVSGYALPAFDFECWLDRNRSSKGQCQGTMLIGAFGWESKTGASGRESGR